MRAVQFYCFVLSTLLLLQIAVPTICMAIPGNSDSGRIRSSVGASSGANVSLSNGAFKYAIPITSVPEYPISINYTSGQSPLAEAGPFGFGFGDIVPGISRIVNGFPDDLNGGVLSKKHTSQKMKDYGLGFGVSTGIAEEGSFDMSINGNVFYRYNNYTGLSMSFGMGLGVGFAKSILDDQAMIRGYLGAGIQNSSSEESIGVSTTGSAGISFETYDEKSNPTGTYSLSGSFNTQKLINSKEKPSQAFSLNVRRNYLSLFQTGWGNRSFSSSASTNTMFLPNLHRIHANNKSFSIALSAPIPIAPGVTLTVSGSYADIAFGNTDRIHAGYGAYYLDQYNRQSGSDHMADFAIEGEFFGPDRLNNPTYLQKDQYMVNVPGLSGNMELMIPNMPAFSRNYKESQQRTVSAVSVAPMMETGRVEQLPLTSIGKTRINPKLNVLEALKGKAFDEIFFEEEKTIALDQGDKAYARPVFRMRGDMSGDMAWQNHGLNSENGTLDIQYKQVPGTKYEETSGKLFRKEKHRPLYYPRFGSRLSAFLDEDNQIAYQGQMEQRSTDIQVLTVGELMEQFDQGFQTGDLKTNYDLDQSIFNHYVLNDGSAATAPVTVDIANNNSQVELFNLFDHLESLKGQQYASEDFSNQYFDHLIGGIIVTATNGVKYYFTLPVFSHESTEMGLAGKGVLPPVIDNGDYASFGDKKRGKSYQENMYKYPSDWLLTAVVYDDFVDVDEIPGPSEGDLGNWVKFKYLRTHDKFHWRTPIVGMFHSRGDEAKFNDDFYRATSGHREVYKLAAVESPEHISYFTLGKRADGREAGGGIVNGRPWNQLYNIDPVTQNSLGNPLTGDLSNFLGQKALYAVTEVNLYKKNAHNSVYKANAVHPKGYPISGTAFTYDYSTGSQALNNTYSASGSAVSASVAAGYHHGDASAQIGTGKLTLRSVTPYIYTQDDIPDKRSYPPYLLTYDQHLPGGSSPVLDDQQNDLWGSYKSGAQLTGKAETNLGMYTRYCPLGYDEAADNANRFQLKEIKTSLGGKIQVQYGPRSYASVEDKIPYVMRQIRDGITFDDVNKSASMMVDITDIIESGGTGLADVFDADFDPRYTKEGESDPDRVRAQKEIYAEATFFRNTKNPTFRPDVSQKSLGTVTIGESGLQIVSFGTPVFDENLQRHFQPIVLKKTDEDAKGTPLKNRLKQFLIAEGAEGTSAGSVGVENELNQELFATRDGGKEVLFQLIDNLKNVFDGSTETQIVNTFGTIGSKIVPEMSFVRTPVYKAKYTGSCVTEVQWSDEFGDFSTEGRNSTYVTRYFYDKNADGTGISAGVATIEPGGGYATVTDYTKITGNGFYASPMIVNGVVTVEQGSYIDGQFYGNGKEIHEYFTPAEPGFRFEDNFKEQWIDPPPNNGKSTIKQLFAMQRIKRKIPFTNRYIIFHFPIPVYLNYKKWTGYHTKSYTYTDVTDYYGLETAVRKVSNDGEIVQSMTKKYFMPDETIPVCEGDFNQLRWIKPGRYEQSWTELYKSKRANNLTTTVYLKGRTRVELVMNNSNYTYIPPVLKELKTNNDGVITHQEFTRFDATTLVPVQTESVNEFGDKVIQRTVPAYWDVADMGPIDNSAQYPTSTNQLIPSSQTIQYLGTVSNDRVLSYGVNEWKGLASGMWKVTPPLQRSVVDDGGSVSHRYNYKTHGWYVNAVRGRNKTGSPLSLHNNIFRPYKSWVYSGPVVSTGEQRGVFNGVDDFGTRHYSRNWKNTNTTEYYNAALSPAQTKDILDRRSAAHQIPYLGFSHYAVNNAPWDAVAYSGAEYRFISPTGDMLLEDPKIDLHEAQIVATDCDGNPVSGETLDLSEMELPGGTEVQAHVAMLVHPAAFTPDEPLFRVLYADKPGEAYTSIYFYLDAQGKPYALTAEGIAFEGFFYRRIRDYLLEMVFDGQQASMQMQDRSLLDGHIASLKTEQKLINEDYTSCYANPRSYKLNNADCFGQSHTGVNLFRLDPGDIGTVSRFALQPVMDQYNVTGMTAMAWFHGESNPDGEIVAAVVPKGNQPSGNEPNQVSISLENAVNLTDLPKVNAGPWNLLRLEFDLENISSGLNPEDYDLIVYVKNPVTGGALFYDDIRVQPQNAEMNMVQYDPHFGRNASAIDNTHFYSKVEYDDLGRAKRQSVEVEKAGERTVQRKLYGNKTQ